MSDDEQNFTPQINYELLVESALRTVVRSSLKIAEENGLPGEAHFYITFLTKYPGVFGWLLYLACTGAVFMAGAKILDCLKYESGEKVAPVNRTQRREDAAR